MYRDTSTTIAAAAAAARGDMETSGYPYGHSFNNNTSRGHFRHNHSEPALSSWADPTATPGDYFYAAAAAGVSTPAPSASATHARLFSHPPVPDNHLGLYPSDPHLTCLKLGKRHYFEDAAAAAASYELGGFSIVKKGKPYCGGVAPSTAAHVPRCQVEGCQAALVSAKEYHRRHKVCEVHAKAPKVVVLGVEQRFCQQCSRFHGVSEFDDSKRSCRRRLAGHNERRRKSSHDSAPRTATSQGRALSLLSSKPTTDAWTIYQADLSVRSSAALRELIAEHRATILARQLILDKDQLHSHNHHHNQTMLHDLGEAQSQPGSAGGSLLTHAHNDMLPHLHNSWSRLEDEAGRQVTLDLMQAASSAFGLMSVRQGNLSKAKEDGCSDLWNSFDGV